MTPRTFQKGDAGH